jgi:predicted transcriptional regulator
MKAPNQINATDWTTFINEIRASDLPEVEKLAQAFGWITRRYVEHAQQEVELARAMADGESLVKEQIKLEMMKHVRSIFQDCYRLVTGRRAWDE